MWNGLEAFWRISKKEGKEPSEQSLDDSLCCFCSNYITSWYNTICQQLKYCSFERGCGNEIKLFDWNITLKHLTNIYILKPVSHLDPKWQLTVMSTQKNVPKNDQGRIFFTNFNIKDKIRGISVIIVFMHWAKGTLSLT